MGWCNGMGYLGWEMFYYRSSVSKHLGWTVDQLLEYEKTHPSNACDSITKESCDNNICHKQEWHMIMVGVNYYIKSITDSYRYNGNYYSTKEKAQEAQNDEARKHEDQSIRYKNLGLYASALAEINKAIEILNWEIYHNLRTQIQQERIAKIETLKASALESLGKGASNDFKSAKQNFEELSKLDDSNIFYKSHVKYVEALIYKAEDKYDEALGLLDEAINAQNWAMYHIEKARIYIEQEEYDDALVALNKISGDELNKAEYKDTKACALKLQASVLKQEFDTLIVQELSQDTQGLLDKLQKGFQQLVNNGVNDASIANRLSIVDLRIQRYDLNNISTTNHRDLLEKIKELIQSERKLIKDLLQNETDNKNLSEAAKQLKTELSGINKELNALEKEVKEEKVDLMNVAKKTVATGEKIENTLKEVLAQQYSMEKGSANDEHPYLTRDRFEVYDVGIMNKFLGLRIANSENKANIKLMGSQVIKRGEFEVADLVQIILAKEKNDYKAIIIPLLIPSMMEKDIMHWVGIIIEKASTSINVLYLDSENQPVFSGLDKIIISFLEAKQLGNPVTFKQIPVNQQKYNNCGPELIENIALYLSGSRVSQEEAVYLHSSLYAAELINSTLNVEQIKFNEFEAIYSNVLNDFLTEA